MLSSTGEPAALAPAAARNLFRHGESAPTSGWCRGFTQLNLIAVPRGDAAALTTFAERNQQACPVIEVTPPGAVSTPLAPGADLRTDLPGYQVYADGEVIHAGPDATPFWRDDLVTLLIGCSLTFEWGLRSAGIAIRHEQVGRSVPMYRTNRACRPSGPFSGPLVVSMRGIEPDRVQEAIRISARYPRMHGAPVHVGDPAALGIADLDHVDYGDRPHLRPGDVPVFWACGVTPQAAVHSSRIRYAVAHAPGHMLITDVRESEWFVPEGPGAAR